MQIFIGRDQPFANDHLEGPVPCKGLSRGAGLLQIIIRRGRPLADDHPEAPASCKWSSGEASLSNTLLHLPTKIYFTSPNIFLPFHLRFSLLHKIYFYLQIISLSPPFFFTSTKINFPSPYIFLLFLLRLTFPLHRNIFFPSPNIIFFYLLLFRKDPSFPFSFSEILIKFDERNVGNTDHCPPLGEVWNHPFRLCRQ